MGIYMASGFGVKGLGMFRVSGFGMFTVKGLGMFGVVLARVGFQSRVVHMLQSSAGLCLPYACLKHY